MVHLLEQLDDIAGTQPLDIKGQDLIVHPGEIGLALVEDLRLERRFAIKGRIDRNLELMPYTLGMFLFISPSVFYGPALNVDTLYYNTLPHNPGRQQ